jgi:hypothetical protein
VRRGDAPREAVCQRNRHGHGRAVAELIEVEGGHLSVLTHLPALIGAMLST